MNQELATRQNQIKTLLVQSQRQITSLLQDEGRAKKFLAASLIVANNPALKNCSAESIVQALVGVALADLNVDPQIGHCYLVPYKDSVTLQLGYKGWIQLLWRSGWMAKAMPVFNCDHFTMEFNGWDNKVNFVPDIDARDEGDKDWAYQNLRGIFVVARHTETKDEYSLFVSKNVIEKLRLNSPNQKISNYTKPEDKKRLEAGLPIQIWDTWFVEMAQAKSLKKIAKLLPLGDSKAAASLYADDKADIGSQVDYKRTAETGVVIESTATTEYGNGNDAELTTRLDAIDSATNTAELTQCLSNLDKLPTEHQLAVKAAWKQKSDDLRAKAKNNTKDKSDNAKPETKGNVKPDANKTLPIVWKARLNECGDAGTLNALLETMPEAEQMEYQDTIDQLYDSFR